MTSPNPLSAPGGTGEPYDGPPELFEPMLQWFAWSHLPPKLREVSQPFGDLARKIVATLPRNPERTVALRKLLESKDCAVRAALDTSGGFTVSSELGFTKESPHA